MSPTTRRRFLGGAAAAALPLTARAAARRPNILFAIADDWSWPFASIAGDRTVKTPAFDRVAHEGVLFRHAYCVAPTCTASRGAILTGQWFARLEQGADLWSTLPAKFDVYPDILERAGYAVGLTGKGWGPGDFTLGGRTRNPAGPLFAQRTQKAPYSGIANNDYAGNFADFLAQRKPGQPFCFWYGGHEPHRPYEEGSGLKAGKKLADVRVPGGLPDVEAVRSDLLDYAVEIDWFDSHLGRMIAMLEKAGELENTIIAVTGDNGLPFPRSKANLYNNGTNVPLAVRWGAAVKGGRTVEDFISHADLAPTFLEAAGLPSAPAMTARSFLNVLRSSKSGWVDPKRDRVFVGRERHTQAQPDGPGGYPTRALRTRDYLYIRNFRPERFPIGTEPHTRPFADVDNGPSKTYMMDHRTDAAVANLFELGFGKRPAEELYELRSDVPELKNRAADPALASVRKKLSAELEEQLKAWKDPRVTGGGDVFDTYPYLGNQPAAGKKGKK
jgi:N-sulfoglucosamine sulfohydrolase